jgi:hypothetical protein
MSGASLAPNERARKTVLMQPETRYAKSRDVHIAYQVVGDRPIDLVWIPSLAHHVELNWENPVVAPWLERLAGLGRLIVFDKREPACPTECPTTPRSRPAWTTFGR